MRPAPIIILRKTNMKFTKTSGMLGLAALAAFTGPLAMAQGAGWYGGGQRRAGPPRPSTTSASPAACRGRAWARLRSSDRDRDTGYKVFGGYQLNRNFARRSGLLRPGKLRLHGHHVPAGTLGGDIRVKGLNLDLVGTLPITDRLSALGRVGVTSARTTGSFSATGAVAMPYANANPSQRATNYKVGAGLMYDFTDIAGDAAGGRTLSHQRRRGQQGPCRHALGRPDLPLRRQVGAAAGRRTATRSSWPLRRRRRR